LSKTVIILGSSRSAGDTATIVQKLQVLSGFDCIDLRKYNISYYDYQHHNKTDDFIPLMRRVIQQYDTIIFATPVYWYTMSGILKVFFDRISDLLTIEKDVGRKLRGKGFAILSCSLNSSVSEEFWHPFKSTAEYLGMNYMAQVHINSLDDTASIKRLVSVINSPSH